MPKFRGAGGVVWEIDVPEVGTSARERHDAQVASGSLVPAEEPKKAPAAKKAAPVADTTEV